MQSRHVPNQLRSFVPSGLLDILNGMNSKLEDIMRSLDMYLETKRQIFPRFYFISNDDLLEILGQSKNPLEIQHHFRKCFDNIKTLNMAKVWLIVRRCAYVVHGCRNLVHKSFGDLVNYKRSEIRMFAGKPFVLSLIQNRFRLFVNHEPGGEIATDLFK